MKAPDFWWRRTGLIATLLRPFSLWVSLVAKSRMKKKGRVSFLPVICVGNPVVGGAGKTPTALALCALLQENGYKTVFVSRGYGGRLQGPVVVDREIHKARDVGDEPLLLACSTITIISRDRAAAIALAETTDCDVIIMDDGFQNPSVVKDYSFLVVDARRGIGNGRVIPAGPLRAPLSEQLDLASSLMVIGHAPEAQTIVRPAAKRAMRIFEASIEPERAVLERIGTDPVVAYAGLGRPGKLFDTLEQAGKSLAATFGFPDHHVFREKDARALLSDAHYRGARLVTTDKDYARLPEDESILGELRRNSLPLPVSLLFDDKAMIMREIKPIIQRKLVNRSRAEKNLPAQ